MEKIETRIVWMTRVDTLRWEKDTHDIAERIAETTSARALKVLRNAQNQRQRTRALANRIARDWAAVKDADACTVTVQTLNAKVLDQWTVHRALDLAAVV